MTWHIVAMAGARDTYAPVTAPGDEVLVIPFNVPGHSETFGSNTAEVFAAHGVTPSVEAEDLLNAATSAYIADLRVPRKTAYDSWTRDIVLHLFVRSERPWDQVAPVFSRLLSFLTGDRWTIHVRPAPDTYTPVVGREPRERIKLNAATVCLFSGGLDSYIGAIDQLADGGQVVLVGHHASGGGATSRSQNDAIGALRTIFAADQTPFLRLRTAPPKLKGRTSETTTRARSIIFLALGVAVADGIGAERLVVPENGFISLNVPLRSSRLGSFSTRTTHPHLIALMRDILTLLAINVAIDLPYRFRTKGEMVASCRDQAALDTGLAVTISCSRPAAGRFVGNPNLHCGRCIPCLIRRAAIRTSRADPTAYDQTDLGIPRTGESGVDLRVVRMALDRFRRRPPTIGDVLTSGPLAGTDDDLRGYLDVFRNGLAELRALLHL
jgi:7-cyano-7-deazaguanine synthase in queuosine biosynthesis